jgi:hypothetical protein
MKAAASARGARPAMRMSHTSLSQMLVYSFVDVDSFWRSAAFAVLILGAAMVTGAPAGIRTLAALAAGGLVSAFWLRRRLVGQPDSRKASADV